MEYAPYGPCVGQGTGPLVTNVGCTDPTANNYMITAEVSCAEAGFQCNQVVSETWNTGWIVSPDGCQCC